jgi:hypothetical protein
LSKFFDRRGDFQLYTVTYKSYEINPIKIQKTSYQYVRFAILAVATRIKIRIGGTIVAHKITQKVKVKLFLYLII